MHNRPTRTPVVLSSLLALAAFACSSATPDNLPVDAPKATTPETSQPTKAPETATTAPSDSAECGKKTTAKACEDCCLTKSPNAAKVADDVVTACICETPGTCKAACGESLCAGAAGLDKEPTDACSTCLETNGVGKACDEKGKAACEGNAACKALDACFNAACEPIAQKEEAGPNQAPSTPAAGATGRLPNSPVGFFNPIPTGEMCGYAADTGLDICADRIGVHAIAAGTLDYSEPGHTKWTGPNDTANSVRLKLDVPVVVLGKRITHIYYTHLSNLTRIKREGAPPVRVEAGAKLGTSGTANNVPHLHLGLIIDGRVGQNAKGDVLSEREVRVALGGYAPGAPLPNF